MTSPAGIQQGLAAFVQAQALHKARHYKKAAALYRDALARIPNHPGILDAFARLATETREWRVAGKLYALLVQLQPDIAAHHEHLARCLGHQQCWDDALPHAERAWAQQQDAAFLYTLLHVLLQLGDGTRLDHLVPTALARFPDNAAIRAACATHLLKRGSNYARAFTMLHDMRASADPASRNDPAATPDDWDGHAFAGTLEVVADGGLGDQLLAATMFADLIRIGQYTEVVCDARLVPLLQRSFAGIRFVAAESRQPPVDRVNVDMGVPRRFVPAMDLGRFFRRQHTDFPIAGGWLRAEPERAARLRDRYAQRWPGRQLVGISWASARRMEDGTAKGIPLTAFAPVLQVENRAFVSLQYGDTRAELLALRNTQAIEVLADPEIDSTHDIDGLAAQVAALDLVITTSNVTAHIAGALGKPCWLVLPRRRPVLWYWGYDGDHTAWYPSIRMFRSTVEGDWNPVMSVIAAALRQYGGSTP